MIHNVFVNRQGKKKMNSKKSFSFFKYLFYMVLMIGLLRKKGVSHFLIFFCLSFILIYKKSEAGRLCVRSTLLCQLQEKISL